MALPFKPVNLGDRVHGGALRPSRDMHPTSHWKRDMTPDFRAVIDGMDAPDHGGGNFRQSGGGGGFRQSGQGSGAGLCRQHLDFDRGRRAMLPLRRNQPRHSVGYSLGFEGKTEKLPNSQVLMLTTMCGHGMIVASLAKKMIDWVKEGRRTPDQAVTYMARFCSCGVFNPARAQRILEDARKKME